MIVTSFPSGPLPHYNTLWCIYQALKARIQTGPDFMCIAVGGGALMLVTSGVRNFAAGDLAGSILKTGSRNWLIGRNTQTPTPETNDYVNLFNVVKFYRRKA